MKKIGIIIGISIIAVGAMLLTPIFQQRPRWPTVSDPNALLAECAIISDSAPAGQYPQQKWGPAIQTLRPRFVVFEEKRINIVLSTGGIGESWGFMVYPDLRTNGPSGVAESKIVVPGIFRYK